MKAREAKVRLVAMDWMRGLAALWVVFFHINEPIQFRHDLYSSICKIGWLGVPVFFVISGWCMSQLEQKAQVPSRFMIARWLRIYPPYIISVVLTLAVIGLSVAWRGVNDLASLPKTPVALLSIIGMATDPATATPNINWSYWTLPVEFAFYIVIYTAIVVSSMRSTGTRKDSGIVSLALLGSGAVILLKVKTSATALFWMPYFPMFALGYYSHRLLPDANPDKERNLTLAFLAVAIVLILLDSQPIPRVLAASLGALILAAEANRKIRLESTNNYAKALGFLGAISYSLYLTHVPIACYLLIRLRTDFILDNQPVHAMVDTAIVVITCLAATAFFWFVEKPFHRLAKRL